MVGRMDGAVLATIWSLKKDDRVPPNGTFFWTPELNSPLSALTCSTSTTFAYPGESPGDLETNLLGRTQSPEFRLVEQMALSARGV